MLHYYCIFLSLWAVWHGGFAVQLLGEIDKIFTIINKEANGCNVEILPETTEWCNDTLNSYDLLPDFTLCQTDDQSRFDLLCRHGIWWNGKSVFRNKVRNKRSAIKAVLDLQDTGITCSWICAVDTTDIEGKKVPVYDFCPDSATRYPEGNSTEVTHEWLEPVVADLDGNITSFKQIVGPVSSSPFKATKTPGTIYHVSYMAEDDDTLKWPCSFTINAEIPVCPAIVDFKHGEYSCDNENNRASTCTFHCEDGYHLNTANTTVCQDNGTWSFGDDIPECLPIYCGEIVTDFTGVDFNCQEDSHYFGSICWASCKYGYILRNDLQEQEEVDRLSDLAAAASTQADKAKDQTEMAEKLRNMAEEAVNETNIASEKALAAYDSAAEAAAVAETEFNQLSEQYNQTYILAMAAMAEAERAVESRAANADELLNTAQDLTTEAETIKADLVKANESFIRLSEEARLAGIAADEAINALSAAEMYLNETEINLAEKIVEEAEAGAILLEADRKLSNADLYIGQDNRRVNTYATCTADGIWKIPGEPYCIDTEPPILKCIPLYSLYLPPGKSTVTGTWPRPAVLEEVEGTAEVYRILGPAEGTALEAGQYVVQYEAQDSSGNVSPVCSVIINVEVRSCMNISAVIPDNNLKASCDSYTAGSTCSLSCNDNYVLEGDDLVKCEDDSATSEIDVRWNLDNPSCTVEACPVLAEPANGNITCKNTTEGDTCYIVCNDGYMLPYKVSNVYHCGEAGVWSPETLPSECIERGEVQVAAYTLSISYLSSNECYQFEIEDQQITLEIILRSHIQTFQRCETDYECMLGKTNINCNEEEQLVTFTMDIVTTCSDDSDSSCDLSSDLMESLENDLQTSINDVGILDHLNITLPTQWLTPVSVDIPTCPSGSILVRAYCEKCDTGSFLDRDKESCTPCPIGTYLDIPGQTACNPCPPRTNTTSSGRSSPEECRDLCIPGSYSETSMIPCVTCPTGTYQSDYGETQCNKCPNGTWTTIAGADTIDKCTVFDMYFEKDFLLQDIGIQEFTEYMSAIFWVKGFEIPILEFGLFYDDTDFAFKLATEENIHIFTDTWDNTPTDIPMTSNEWIMLAVIWNAPHKELELYKNGELAFNMKTKENLMNPTKVMLSVKKETFLSGFIMTDRIWFSNIIKSYYSECGTTTGFIEGLTALADLRLDGLQPVPSTCQASTVTTYDSCFHHGCQNNGVCVLNDTSGYTCNCTDGYGGFFCEVELVHGDWSEWIPIAECSVTCGSGVQAFYRLCNNPSPGRYGNDCEGNSTDLVECQMEDCQECDMSDVESGTICVLEDEECVPVCKEGRVLPKGQLEQKFRCGVSTNYKWVPLERLPICASVSRPSKYTLTSTFEVNPEIPCEYLTNITKGFELAVADLICPRNNSNCVAKVKIEECLEQTARTKRQSTTTIEVEFQVTLTSDGIFDLEKYFETQNMTESIDEMLKAITDIERTIEEILVTPTALDVLFVGVTYTIVPATITIIAVTSCPPRFVDTQGLCVDCQKGTRMLNGWCVYCDRGTYQDTEGQSECTPCPAGKTTLFVGARSESECIDEPVVTDRPSPSAANVGIIVGIAIGAILGIILVVILVCTILKFYITSKRRRQYDMEAETTSLYTEFPDIAYNMYFKNKQFVGFDEKGLPVIANGGFENGDAKYPFNDDGYPFGNEKGEKLPPLIPPLEPFSFSARPVKDMPFDHPPPKLKKKSFVKPSMDPLKQFNFPDMREIPVRFKVPKRKHFQNKYPRHTFGLEDEEEGYISKTVPIPKNATRLLYKSPTGENIYRYLFPDGIIRKIGTDDEIGVQPDLPLLKAQYLGENGEFEQPPPVFEKLKLGDEPTGKLKKRKMSGVSSRISFGDKFDSRPSTAKPGSRPSTTKSKGRASVVSPRSHGSPRSRGSQRFRGSPRSRGASHVESYRSTSSNGSPRAKSALLRAGSRSAKSVSIVENGDMPRPSTAGTYLSRAKSTFSDARLVNVAETYRPKSINMLESPRQVLNGVPVIITSEVSEDQMSITSTSLRDQKMKFMAPPVSKSRPKSVTPDVIQASEKDELVENVDKMSEEMDINLKEVRFDDGQTQDLESVHDSDSSGSVVYTKRKDSGKRNSDTSRASVNGGPVPRPIIPEGMKVLRTSKDFFQNLNLPMPPRGHQMKPMAQPPAFLKATAETENEPIADSVSNVADTASSIGYNTF